MQVRRAPTINAILSTYNKRHTERHMQARKSIVSCMRLLSQPPSVVLKIV